MTKAVFKNLSNKEKKAQVIMQGNRMERLVCPMCGKNQYIESKNKTIEDARFADPKGVVLQVVYGGGRGSGFHAHLPECLTIKEMKQNTKYTWILERMRVQCNAILEVLE